MKRQGEIINIRQSTAIVRIYKEKHDDYEPTSLTVSSSLTEGLSVGDTVCVEINMLFFILSTLSGYLLPIAVAFLTFVTTHNLTDNIILAEVFTLASLGLTYIFAVLITQTPFFTNIPCCHITGVFEE